MLASYGGFFQAPSGYATDKYSAHSKILYLLIHEQNLFLFFFLVPYGIGHHNVYID